ncbi:MAG: hypothetical protein BWZ08_01437 [candidate division BRC1 bacterium ADurb.BinA292]|nr:MAG: hypothetical protein BWZ08_01437 [candidate division BRC1 bacterium ADurb.BinA292]
MIAEDVVLVAFVGDAVIHIGQHAQVVGSRRQFHVLRAADGVQVERHPQAVGLGEFRRFAGQQFVNPLILDVNVVAGSGQDGIGAEPDLVARDRAVTLARVAEDQLDPQRDGDVDVRLLRLDQIHDKIGNARRGRRRRGSGGRRGRGRRRRRGFGRSDQGPADVLERLKSQVDRIDDRHGIEGFHQQVGEVDGVPMRNARPTRVRARSVDSNLTELFRDNRRAFPIELIADDRLTPLGIIHQDQIADTLARQMDAVGVREIEQPASIGRID